MTGDLVPLFCAQLLHLSHGAPTVGRGLLCVVWGDAPVPVLVLVDAKLAAHAAQVTPRCIRLWVKSGRLVNHGSERRILVDLWALPEPALKVAA